MSLEPRFMFDAAGLITADDLIQEEAATDSGETQETNTNPDSESEVLEALTATQTTGQINEIVFVDTSVANYESLLEGIDANAEVVLIDGTSNGLAQIAEALQGRTGIEAIHIISHGDAGELQLGAAVLTQSSMEGQYAATLAQISEALGEDADILIYGCNFAEGEAGRAAADMLASLTGADVAASTDLTGHADFKGDWELEYQSGEISTASVLADSATSQWQHLLMDTDLDGIDDATDLDSDNDGINNTVEGYQTSVTFTTDFFDIGTGAATQTYEIDLTGTGLTADVDTVDISNFLASGDLNSPFGGNPEVFTVQFNLGLTGQQAQITGLATGEQFNGLVELNNPINVTVPVTTISGGKPGITLTLTVPTSVNALAGLGYGVRTVFDITYLTDIDTDSDGTPDYIDIDSDNDGITDNIEAQATNNIVLPSGIGGGITDGNTNGIDDNYGTGLTPVDTDGDGIADFRDADSDDDGVDDIAERGDGQPITLTSTTDTDGDGLVDIFEGGTISDADINDDNLIFDINTLASDKINLADTDDDVADDGSDATGTNKDLDFRENNLLDIDEDGIDNDVDVDADNDGILNVNEGAPGVVNIVVTSSAFTVAEGTVEFTSDDTPPLNNPTNPINTVDLTGSGLEIGDTVVINNIRADGDTNGTGEHFGLKFNGGDASEVLALDLATGQQTFGNLLALVTAVSVETKVIDIGGGTPGVTVEASTPQEVDDFENVGYGVRYQFDVTATKEVTRDTDGDGLPDHLDIDSDNDGITDNVEAQTTAGYTPPSGGVNASGLDATAYGAGLTPIDSDSDGIADVLDVDSDNDGIGDIGERRDGAPSTLTSLTDSDSDGLLDIFEGSNVNDEDVNDENVDNVTTFTIADSDNDLAGNLTNASPPGTDLDYRESDFDGDNVLNADDDDADNDGLLNSEEGVVTQTFVSNVLEVATGPIVDQSFNIDLSSTPLNIGDTVTITNIRGDGDLDGTGGGGQLEVIDLVFNNLVTLNDIQTGGQYTGNEDAYFFLGNTPINDFTLTVTDIGNDTPGINVLFSADGDVGFGGNFGAQVRFDVLYDDVRDSDGDGFPDHLDLDSDNDGITDNVEAQATEDYEAPGSVNGNGVPSNYNSGAGLSPVDSDNDLIPDYLDADSDADGLNDIAERGDNQPISITSTLDSDADGLLDIFEGSNINDIDQNDQNFDGGVFLLSDSDDDTDADGNNANALIRDLDFRDDLRDIDADSIPNISDPDADGDGILNAADGVGTDTDGDGLENYLDIDSDNDGITDNVEAQTTDAYEPPTGIDTDGDGVDNAYDPDDGGTTLSPTNTDSADVADFLDPDSDNDGINDIAERGDGQPRAIISTDDVDADGLLDIFEGSSSADIDPNDGNIGAGSPFSFNLGDTDADTPANGNGATPLVSDFDYRDLADTDGDSVANVNDVDDDNDGILDTAEGSGSNTDTDGDGVPDYLDLDSDNDGLSDLFESGASAVVIARDTNSDGFISAAESASGLGANGLINDFGAGTTPTNSDGGGDSIADFRDLDSDNDGIADTIEFRATAGFTTNDGDVRDDDEDGDGVIAQFDSNDDPDTGVFGASFSNTAVDTDGDGTPDYRDTNSDNDQAAGDDAAESGFTFSSTDANNDGIDDNASIGVSYSDPDGVVTNPSTNFTNQFGDTAEVGYRERLFQAVDDSSVGEVNEVDSTLSRNIISDNDVFDNADGSLTVRVTEVTSSQAGTVAVPGSGTVNVATNQNGIVTIDAAGNITYDPNNQTVFNDLEFGDDPVIDSFTYKISYGGTETDTATVTISVEAKNEFELSSLTGTNGTTFTGANENDQAGFKVEDLGDVNGDGYDDFSITAVTASPGGNNLAGEVYVLFGTPSGYGATFGLGSLASGNGSNGFVLTGAAQGDLAGRSVTGGDVNGDGFADIILSSSRADTPNGDNSGEVYVLFGRSSGDFTTLLGGSGSYSLAGLATGGSDGFTFRGIDEDDNTGRTVAFAGDVDGDGIGDLLIGSHLSDPGGNADAGEVYLIYGQTDFSGAFTSGVFELSSLAGGGGTYGTLINGETANDRLGFFVAGAGDFNGDGFDDIAIGANYATGYDGSAYVIYGASGGLGATLDISGLNGTNGFELTGPAEVVGPSGTAYAYAGSAVSLSGDLNGDGFADLIVSAPGASPNGSTFSGTTYVVFGTNSAFLATQGIAGSASVTINGVASAYNTTGFALDSSGDINGDGYDDILLGRGPFSGIDSGAVYVVFGDSALSGSIELGDLVPVSAGGTDNSSESAGFVLSGVDFDSYAGQAVSVAADVNGDGFDDLVIGAYAADPNYAGEAYIIYGGDFANDNPTEGTNANNVLLGTTAANILIGGDGNDYIDGAGNNDVLLGGNGDDRLIFDPSDTVRVDGGGGTDTLDFVDSSAVTLDLTAVQDNLYRDIEVIDITGAGNNTLILSVTDVLALSGSTNVLTINGNANDSVTLAAGGTWTLDASDPTYDVYTNGEATVRILKVIGVTVVDVDSPESMAPAEATDEATLAAAIASQPIEGVATFSAQLSAAAGNFESRAQLLMDALKQV